MENKTQNTVLKILPKDVIFFCQPLTGFLIFAGYLKEQNLIFELGSLKYKASSFTTRPPLVVFIIILSIIFQHRNWREERTDERQDEGIRTHGPRGVDLPRGLSRKRHSPPQRLDRRRLPHPLLRRGVLA